MKEFVERNLDVLQNIESAIVQAHRADPSLLDLDVKDAIDALVRHYHSVEEQRTPSAIKLTERAQRIFSSIQVVCEWRLGNSPLPNEAGPPESEIPVSVLVKCLREIQKSIARWSRQGGRKGYLDFVIQYVQ